MEDTKKAATQGLPQKRQKKLTEYGQQLLEKQKLRNSYGLRERQFRNYFDRAAKNPTQTGQALLELLESRLDNTIFRSGLALTRAQARQMVVHRRFKLNDRRVNCPSLQVRPKDVIVAVYPDGNRIVRDGEQPGYLKINKKSGLVEIAKLPTGDDLPTEFDLQKVIEFYSR